MTTDAEYQATELHRRACEARMVANMPTREERIAYLKLVAEKRGDAAARQLREDVEREWLRRNGVVDGTAN